MDVKPKHTELPDVVERTRSRMHKWSFIHGLALFGVLFVGIFSRCSITNTELTMAATLPFMVLVVLWFLWTERRRDIAATLADFALCTHCEYDLTGLDQIGNCPKCGTAYDLEEVRACWQRWRPLWSGPKHTSSGAVGGKFTHVVLPSVVIRSRRYARISCFLLMVAMFESDVYLRNNPSPYINNTSKFVVIMALVLWVVTRAMRFERRLKKAALQADYALCLHCQYDLTGLGKQQHKCPECGTPYDLEYVRACWKNFRTMWEESIGGN